MPAYQAPGTRHLILAVDQLLFPAHRFFGKDWRAQDSVDRLIVIRSMRLSPIDHIFTGRGAYPINFVFSFEKTLDAARLRAGLDRTLESFWPLKSQLVKSGPNDLSFDVSLNGWRWNEEKSQRRTSFDDVAALAKSIPCAISEPGHNLLEISLQQNAEGTRLAVSASHCVVDGYSYFLFLTSWAKASRELPFVEPIVNRDLLRPNHLVPHKAPIDRERVFNDCGVSFAEQKRPDDASSAVRWTTHDFKRAEIDQLMKSVEGIERFSQNDVLATQIWRNFMKEFPGETLKDVADYSFGCPVDYRRLSKRVNPLYFGNAIRCASFKLGVDEFAKASHADLALRLRRAVESVDDAAVERSLECLESLRLRDGLNAMERFHVADPNNGFMVTNLSRLPLFEMDFGTGAPNDFRILTPAKRSGVILPLRDGFRSQTAY